MIVLSINVEDQTFALACNTIPLPYESDHRFRGGFLLGSYFASQNTETLSTINVLAGRLDKQSTFYIADKEEYKSAIYYDNKLILLNRRTEASALSLLMIRHPMASGKRKPTHVSLEPLPSKVKAIRSWLVKSRPRGDSVC